MDFPEEADLQIISTEQIICYVKNISYRFLMYMRWFMDTTMAKQINAKLEETISVSK